MTIQIISLIIIGLIVFYFLRKEHEKHARYFGKSIKYNRKEQSILDSYKKVYKPIPNDKKFPTIQRDGFELEDIQLSATQIIYDNPIPTREEIEKVKKGDFVKLLFTDNDGYVERMWVEVLECGNNMFKGVLRNDAFELENLTDGVIIYFHTNHVYEIDHNSDY